MTCPNCRCRTCRAALASGPRRTRGKGEGSIHQQFRNGHLYWCGAVELPRSPEGKRRRASVVRRDKDEVIAAMGDLRRRAIEGVAGASVSGANWTVSDYLDFWLTEVIAGEVSPGSLATYTDHAARVRPHIGTVRITQLTKAHVQVLANRLAADYAPKTRQVTLSALRSAIEWGVPDYFPTNPARGVRGPRQVTAKVDDGLTVGQADAVLAAAASDRYFALYWLALKYGMRIGEITGLRWVDVDLDGSELTVVRSSTKSDAGHRTLPLTDEAVEVLAAHRRRQDAIDPRVFRGPDGGNLKHQRLRQWWSDLLERAGVPHLCRNCGTDRPCSSSVRRFHASRHTAATLLLQAGVELEVVSAILGHANIGITAGVYAKVRGDLMRKGLERLG